MMPIEVHQREGVPRLFMPLMPLMIILFAVLALLFLHTPAKAAGVVGNGDPASCTEAALDAALAGGGKVTFNCGPNEKLIEIKGEKLLSLSTVIDGENKVSIYGRAQTRLFRLVGNTQFTFANITIRDGYDPTREGGLLAVGKEVTVLIDNAFLFQGSNVAIANSGKVTIQNSKFQSNRSNREGYGGAIHNYKDAVVKISDTSFVNNNAGFGGVIANEMGGVVTIHNGTFTFGQANAGGVLYNSGVMTVTESTFTKSTAGSGGVIQAQSGSSTWIDDSDFIENYASSTGGAVIMLSGNMTLSRATFRANESTIGAGGAIHVANGGKLTLVNATLAENKVPLQHGVVARGDGIFAASGGEVKIINSTLATSNASNPNPGGNLFAEQGAKITLVNSLVEGACFGPITDGGNNLQHPNADCTSTIPVNDPFLGVLQNNGGRHLTMLIAEASPARDTANAALCPATDERGVVRPQGAGCDIGAVEIGSVPTFAINSLQPTTVTVKSSDFELTVSGQNLVQGMTLLFNGNAMQTTVIDGTRLKATIPASQLLTVGIVNVQVKTADGKLSNVLPFQIVEQPVVSGITLNVTVGTANGVCATTKQVTVSAGTKVYFCYVATNKGSVTYDLHTLTDSALGSLFTNRSAQLPPNGQLQHIAEATVQGAINSSATWQASVSSQPTQAQSARDGAQVSLLANQTSADVGNLRIWADQIAASQDGSTTATGNVRFGPKSAGENGKYYASTASVSWKGNGNVSGVGAIGFVNGSALMQGSFTINPDSGAITWQSGAVAAYNKLGSSEVPLSNVSVGFNALSGKAAISGQANVSLYENNALSFALTFQLDSLGNISDSKLQAVTLKLAGSTLQAQASATSNGIALTQMVLTLPVIGNLLFPDLLIDGKGDSKIRFMSESATLPDLNLGDNTLVIKAPTARLEVAEASRYVIRLEGKLTVANVENLAGFEVSMSNLRIDQEEVKGDVAGIPATQFVGLPTKLMQPVLTLRRPTTSETGYEYFLKAASLKMRAPASWTIVDSINRDLDVPVGAIVSGQAPHFRVLGKKVPIKSPINLLGDKKSNVTAKLTDVSAEIKYGELGPLWHVELTATLKITVGVDSGNDLPVRITLKDGHVSAKLLGLDLKVAGLALKIEKMDYQDDLFTAARANLTLPNAWGGHSITVNNVRIDPDHGLQIGDGTGVFPIPEISPNPYLRISGASASIQMDAAYSYTIGITATLAISNALPITDSTGLMASGHLRIANGKVDGTLSGFGFKMVGLEFRVANATFLEDRIKAEEVALSLPKELGNAGTTLRGLEIGGTAGFSIRGGSFKLPDFAIGTVGMKNVMAEFERDAAGNFTIGARAKISLEAFAVEGGFKLIYIAQPPHVELRQVSLVFEGQIKAGTAIPVANTGFFITRISGSFDLTSETFVVALGVKAAFGLEVDGVSVATIEGQVQVKGRPFEIRTNASTALVGILVGQAELIITDHSFTLTGNLEAQIIRASLQLAFGMDIDNELTMYGKLSAQIGLKAGSIGQVGWPPFTAKLPPFDLNLGTQTFDAGKFRHDGQKVWGGRLSTSLFGFNCFVFARIAPGVGVDAGLNLNSYTPILPRLAASDATPDTMDAIDGLPFEVTVTAPTNSLMILEAVTQTNWIAPQNVQVISPNGVPFTLKLEYESPDKVTRIYSVKLNEMQQAVGLWKIQAQAGNQIKVWGVDPAPSANAFSATASNGVTLAAAEAQVDSNPTFTSESFTVNWSASNDAPGFVVYLFAEDANGTRYTIANKRSTNETQLTGNESWTPALPNGVYTITMAVDDFRNTVTYARSQQINFNDMVAPAPVVNLQAQSRADGSVLLTWDGASAAADVAGYQVVIDGGTPFRTLGKLNQYEVYGLSAGSTHQMTVAAYDLNGNIGTPVAVGANVPSVAVNVLTPVRNGVYREGAVVIVYDRAVTPGSITLVDANTTPVAGMSELIMEQSGIETAAVVGMKFVPGAQLAPGVYTATATVTANGAPVEVSWSFTVVTPTVPTTSNLIFLPVVSR